MIRVIGAVCLWLATVAAAAAQQVWVQIEAQPSLAEAQAAARDYAARLDGVAGYDLGNSWYAIALGPFEAATTAEATLDRLRGAGAIPRDSYISRGASYGARFFPGGPSDAPAAPAQAQAPAEVSGETLAEARRSERLLTRDERMEVQTALDWAGVYDGAIDAAFGPSTRSAMADWQVEQGYPATGVLTTAQRVALRESYSSVLDDLGMEPVSDRRAGVEVAMPTELVSLSRYAPPFAYYDADGDSPVQVLLISRPGDATALRGLYDVMQTLDVVPAEGPREWRGRSFTLEGRNDRIVSTTYAELADGAIKGFTLVWPAGDDARRSRVLERMRASFRPLGGALPAEADAAAVPDLLSGLEIQRPERNRTGFFVDNTGSVLTTAEAVAGCRRVTLGDGVEADVAFTDARLGLALLRPQGSLSPADHARFRLDAPRPQSQVAVAGYPFGGVLPAPSLTFGQVVGRDEPGGDPARQRLALAAEPGDAGGPILDDSGAVVGLLQDPGAGARTRSGEGAFGTHSAAIARFLSDAGVSPAASTGGAAVAPEDLTRLAAEMAVPVNCWN